MAAEVECQLPSAGLHRQAASPSRAFQARPTAGACLSLAQLKELYADDSKQPKSSKARASPHSSPRCSPQNSPLRSRTRQAPQSCSPSTPSHEPPNIFPSPCFRNSTGDVPSAPSSGPARSRLGRSPGVVTPAEAPVVSPESRNEAQQGIGRNNFSGGKVEELAQAKPFVKSWSLQSDRLSLKKGLKSALAEDRELRHARSLGRRVSFNNQIEVIVYPVTTQ